MVTKRLIIKYCSQCPHFIKAGLGEYSETCRKSRYNIIYDLLTRDYPIPAHCPLEDHEETDPCQGIQQET